MLKLYNRLELPRKLQLSYLKKITSAVALSSVYCALGKQPWWKARFTILGQKSAWGPEVKCWRVQRHSWHRSQRTTSQEPQSCGRTSAGHAFNLTPVRSLSHCTDEPAPQLPLQAWEVLSSCSLCKLKTSVNIDASLRPQKEYLLWAATTPNSYYTVRCNLKERFILLGTEDNCIFQAFFPLMMLKRILNTCQGKRGWFVM